MKISRLILLWLTLAILACDNAQTKSDDNSTTEQSRPPIPHDLPLAKPLDIELGITTLAEVKRRFPDGEERALYGGLRYYTLSENEALDFGVENVNILFDSDGYSQLLNLHFNSDKQDFKTIYQSLAEKYFEYPLSAKEKKIHNENIVRYGSRHVSYAVNHDVFISGNGVIRAVESYLGEIDNSNVQIKVGLTTELIILDNPPNWIEEPKHRIVVSYMTDYYDALEADIKLKAREIALLSADLYAVSARLQEAFNEFEPSSSQEERLFNVVKNPYEDLSKIFSQSTLENIVEYIIEPDTDYYVVVSSKFADIPYSETDDFLEKQIEEAEYLVEIAPLVKDYFDKLNNLMENIDNLSDADIVSENEAAFATLEAAVKALDAQRLQKLL